MKKIPYSKYEQGKLAPLLNGIPFFADLSIGDPSQYSFLLEHAEVMELKPGDMLIKKGSRDRVVYFLLKGELGIYTETRIGRRSQAVSHISQGQVVGALAVLSDQFRTASVAADKEGGDAIVLALDFELFGELDDVSQMSLATKLAFYRIVINSTRFKLEGYKNRAPNHPLAEVYSKIKNYTGDRDTLAELQYHSRQASMFARILEKWNEV